MIEPGHPFQGGQFQRFPCFPGGSFVDQFSLVQTINSLCQCVVVAVPLATGRGFYTCFGETLGITDGDLLGASVGVVDERL